MEFQVTIPYEEKSVYGGGLRRPTVYYNEKLIKDVPDKEIVMGFRIGKGGEGFHSLCNHAEVIKTKNADAVWALVKDQFDVNKVPGQYAVLVIYAMLNAKGWNNLYDLFEILENQTGFGWMGGTGCGRLVHDLTFHKVLGVKAEHAGAGLKWVLATLLFSSMLGKVKGVRQEHKHLRDRLKEDEVFVTLAAKPKCQATVHYHGAHGYPLLGIKADEISCKKCAKKLGLEPNARGRRMAGAL